MEKYINNMNKIEAERKITFFFLQNKLLNLHNFFLLLILCIEF